MGIDRVTAQEEDIRNLGICIPSCDVSENLVLSIRQEHGVTIQLMFRDIQHLNRFHVQDSEYLPTVESGVLSTDLDRVFDLLQRAILLHITPDSGSDCRHYSDRGLDSRNGYDIHSSPSLEESIYALQTKTFCREIQ